MIDTLVSAYRIRHLVRIVHAIERNGRRARRMGTDEGDESVIRALVLLLPAAAPAQAQTAIGHIETAGALAADLGIDGCDLRVDANE